MEFTILLDHDLEGQYVFFEAGLKETGWDQLLVLTFKRLRDLGLPDNHPDREIWRYTQQHHILLVTGNRNKDDETSLQATIERENKIDSLPVLTVSDKDNLAIAEYRQRVIEKMVEIIIDLENFRGTGRLFIP